MQAVCFYCNDLAIGKAIDNDKNQIWIDSKLLSGRADSAMFAVVAQPSRNRRSREKGGQYARNHAAFAPSGEISSRVRPLVSWPNHRIATTPTIAMTPNNRKTALIEATASR